MPESDTEKGAGLPVGEYLKSAREARGVTLDEATRVTKISKNYLVAIEQGEFHKLPNAAYIKGFLRLYAGFLSLNGDEVVNRYQDSLPAAPAAARPEPATETQRSSVEIVQKAQTKDHRRWAIPLLLLVLVGIAALFFTDSDDSVPTPPPAVTPAPAPAPVAAPVLPQVTSAAKAPLPAATQATQEAANQGLAPAVRQPGGIILRLRFNQDTWLSITIDDSISQRYELKAGDVIEWKGSRSFVVDVGDGGAVEGELNGRQLKNLGEPGKPAHVELKEQ